MESSQEYNSKKKPVFLQRRYYQVAGDEQEKLRAYINARM